MTILTIVGIIVLLGTIFVSMYNSLVKLRNNRENALTDIDVQLKQHHDLIPQLVDIVEGYVAHKREALDRVTQAYNNAVGAKTIDDRIAAESQLSSALAGLKIILEAYPDLKANQNFLQLQEEIFDVKNKLAAVRRYFNSVTEEYDNAVQTFPSNTVAGMIGFQREIMSDLGKNERADLEQVPKISFQNLYIHRPPNYKSRTRMQYVGIQTQQSRNSLHSAFLLFLLPCLVAALLYLAYYLLTFMGYKEDMEAEMIPIVNHLFFSSLPYIIGIVLIWFPIAYWANTSIISSATGSKSLDHQEDKRVYNLVKNLCMFQGMKMPKINIIYDGPLNAFVSGINECTYTVILSESIIRKLNDEELKVVIAYELGHIRNRDVRLLIISAIFVGIFSMLTEITFYAITHVRVRSNSRGSGGAVLLILIALVIATIGYLFTSLMRFATSRKHEYMADIGSTEMMKGPLALANALRKTSVDPAIGAVERKDVAQLFTQDSQKASKSIFSGPSELFATHPPIEKRIEILEQF